MATVYICDAGVSTQEYDQFVTTQPTCNLLQSSAWANVKNGWDSKRTVLRNAEGDIAAAALVLIRPIKLGYTMWYIPHGPILDYSRGNADEILRAYLHELANIAKKTKCVFIKIDPPVALKAALQNDLPHSYNPASLNILNTFESAGFRHQGFTQHMHDTLQPRVTTATICPPEGKKLLDIVPKRTRRFVKDAANRYVQVEKRGLDGVGDFVAVVEQTEQAKGVHLRNREYFELLMRTYGDDAILHMAYIDLPQAVDGYEQRIVQAQEALAQLGGNAHQKRKEYEQQIASHTKNIKFLRERIAAGDAGKTPVAGCLSVRYGTGLEMLYAGFNRNYSKITAQDLVYITQMQEAFDAGVRYCSIGGVDNSLEDGLMTFKSHFSPLVIEKLGEFDYPVHPLLYRGVRWVLRHR